MGTGALGRGAYALVRDLLADPREACGLVRVDIVKRLGLGRSDGEVLGSGLLLSQRRVHRIAVGPSTILRWWA